MWGLGLGNESLQHPVGLGFQVRGLGFGFLA